MSGPDRAGSDPTTGARVPRIAVIGRQNVGKSTLVNRLFGSRETIAHDMAGVTRDRIELETTWRERRFSLVDTAGYLHDARGIEVLARDQADRAIDEADLIMLVVDARSSITEEDGALARRLRRATVPVLVVANKVDTQSEEPGAADFHALGLGDPFPVSGMHGRAAGDLLDRIVQLLPDAPRDDESSDAAAPRFALVGRPNVGKSSLFNRMVGHQRSVVFEEPAPPATRWTRWCSGLQDQLDSSTRQACADSRGCTGWSISASFVRPRRSSVRRWPWS